jgi:hypothetical protein
MELTSIGDGVNLASRLEGTSKQYGTDIVISENTYINYADKVIVRELDFITVKGKSQPVRIYELVGIREGKLVRPVSEKQQGIIDHYHLGRQYYLKPATDKLTAEEIVPLLEELEEVSEVQMKKLSYDDKDLLGQMLLKNSLEKLTEMLDENIIKRLAIEDFKRMPMEEALAILPEKVKGFTPRETKKLLIVKLKQFTTDENTQKMLEDEAAEMPLTKLRKMVDLAKRKFAAKAKESLRTAKREFLAVLDLDPKNKAAKLHVDRCILYETTQPPDETWDGVWNLTEK